MAPKPKKDLNKTELINEVAEKAGIPKKNAKAAVDSAFQVISANVAKGRNVRIAGFGSFVVKARKKRTGINPQTKAKITIPKKKVPGFRPAAAFKDAVNKKR
jgi:DNA-binding protein HU-beta